MKLKPLRAAEAAAELEAVTLPDMDPAIDSLSELFGDHTFFIDAEGHADSDQMKKAIDEAGKHCLQLTVLGSYPKAVEVL